MPVEVKGAVELRKALQKFTPDLAKEIRKEIAGLLKPVTVKARGYVPNNSPIRNWDRSSATAKFPTWDGRAAKAGIGYKTTPSRPNKEGFRALARIVNASVSGAIYETAGRKHPYGREQAPMARVVRESQANYGAMIRSGNKSQSMSNNPGAGDLFIQAMNQYSEIVNASDSVGRGRPSQKMKGRAIFRAWKEDYGKTNAAVIKAIEASRARFYKEVGYNGR
jgi:hypothetical protein